MDAIDRKIVKLLQGNAKLTTKEIAAEVNLSVSPTFERIKRLENEGVIKDYVAIVDPFKVGVGLVAFSNIRLKQHSKEMGDNFLQSIKQFEEVTEVYNTTGEYDYIIKIYARDIHHFQDFVLNHLGQINSIGHMSSVVVIGREKHSLAIPVW